MSEEDDIGLDAGETEFVFKEYQGYYDAAVALYGPMVAVLMNVGNWWKSYGLAYPDGSFSTNVIEIEIITNSSKIEKDAIPISKKKTADDKHEGAVLRSMGIRIDQLADRIELLQRRGYTIVKYEQYTDPKQPKKFKRRFSEAIPPGIPIIESQDSTEQSRVCIYFSNSSPRSGEPSNVRTAALIVGMSNIDVSTGSVTLYEIMYDKAYGAKGLDEAYRFLQTTRPVNITLIFRGFYNWSKEKQIELSGFINNKLELSQQPHNVQITIKFVSQKRDDVYERCGDISYQQTVLAKVYPQLKSSQKLIQKIGLERAPFACTALTIEFNNLSICDPSIFRRMRLPEIWTSRSNLVLQHNAIEQLDLVPPVSKDSGCGCSVNKRLSQLRQNDKRPEYLIDVIDRTSTNMGARLLLKWIKAPSNQSDEIQARVNTVASFVELSKESRSILHKGFKNIKIDIARTVRLPQFSQFGPKHLKDMVSSFNAVLEVLAGVSQIPEGKAWIKRACPKYENDYTKKIQSFLKLTEDTFDLNKLKLSRLGDWKTDPESIRFFKTGAKTEHIKAIQQIFQSIDESQRLLGSCQTTLATLLFPNLSHKPDELQKKVVMKSLQKTGDIYFTVTKANHSLLHYYIKQFLTKELDAQWFDGRQDFSDRGGRAGVKKAATKTSTHAVDEVNSDEEVAEVDESSGTKSKDFAAHIASFAATAPTTTTSAVADKTKKVPKSIGNLLKGMEFYRLFGGCVQIPAATDSQKGLSDDIRKLYVLVSKDFQRFIDTEIEPFFTMFDEVCDLVASVDVLLSHSLTSIEHNYHKPEVMDNSDTPFIDATVMRHPIIECRLVDTEFVPNDVNIGLKHTGLLIYGVNNIGKTSFEKAVALNLILAQAGCFVAAETWRFSPFDGIITRLNGQDNMRAGQGTFAVEMTELVTILNGNERTLAIGDEICHGTEPASAVSLVAATVKDMAERRIPFLFATHLHHLTQMQGILELDNVGFVHFHTETDPITNDIIYNRKIREGAGLDSYGIEVAKAQGIPERIITSALMIRREVLRQPETFISTRTSRYNRDHIMNVCQITNCEERLDLDTHHIRFQSEADEHGVIDGRYHKNSKHNLVTLCKPHHQLVHKGGIVIHGWHESIERGVYLNYELIDDNNIRIPYTCTDEGPVARKRPTQPSNETKIVAKVTVPPKETKEIPSPKVVLKVKKAVQPAVTPSDKVPSQPAAIPIVKKSSSDKVVVPKVKKAVQLQPAITPSDKMPSQPAAIPKVKKDSNDKMPSQPAVITEVKKAPGDDKTPSQPAVIAEVTPSKLKGTKQQKLLFKPVERSSTKG